MWKIIPGTDELYLASEEGQIMSADRDRLYRTRSAKGTYTRKGRILKQPLNSHGYPCVTIKFKDGSQQVIQVHQLIARTFIPNPNNLPQINHIDGNKQNNHVNNLEWCSARDNLLHAFRTGLNKGSHHMKGKCGRLHVNSIPVVAYNFDGSIYKEFESCCIAAKCLNMSSSSHISACLHGKRKTAGGYMWRFKNGQTSTVEVD